ncbi:hypothetical protein PLICRDRAFT_121088 [Plicaturopsis crispa FD-325 SS-3]|nr:hypothetical protein PLICRDRAFT_121088 [Plicaturopsis crispa FD-325 SS-3]
MASLVGQAHCMESKSKKCLQTDRTGYVVVIRTVHALRALSSLPPPSPLSPCSSSPYRPSIKATYRALPSSGSKPGTVVALMSGNYTCPLRLGTDTGSRFYWTMLCYVMLWLWAFLLGPSST